MPAERAKGNDEEHHIDPALKKEKAGQAQPPAQPVSQTGAPRRENESVATEDEDGQRKRAEEGL